MPSFRYDATDPSGRDAGGVIDAAGELPAIAELKSRGLFPHSVSPLAAPRVDHAPTITGSRGPNRIWTFRRTAVKARELAIFTRQIATLLRAGLPLLRGLETLARQERNPVLKAVVAALADDIRLGSAFSEALSRHPRLFDRLQVNLVRAGEVAGALDTVLDRLAKFREKSLQLRGKVKAALVYPLCVVTVATLILAGLLVFVVPRFRQIFADMLKGATLPPLTQAVVSVSEAVKGHFIILLVVGAAAWVAFGLFRRTPRGRRIVDGLVVRQPLVGELLLKSIVAQFSRTLGTLLASGVPILQALAIARDTCGNERVAGALEVVHRRVKEGDPLASPLADTGVFPPLVTSMVEVGEHTGQLPEMLMRVAEIYEDDVDNAVAGLSALIEPVLIVLLAGVVGTIVVALFLPIIRVVQLLS